MTNLRYPTGVTGMLYVECGLSGGGSGQNVSEK